MDQLLNKIKFCSSVGKRHYNVDAPDIYVMAIVNCNLYKIQAKERSTVKEVFSSPVT